MATVNTTWVNPVGASLDKATGATIDETMTDGWSSNFYHLGGTTGYIGCRATHSATQSLSNATPTAVALNGESFDSDPGGAMHDNTTNNNRVVARTAGVYHVTAYVPWASNATGYRKSSLMFNGSVTYASDTRMAVTGATTEQVVATAAVMAAGDWFGITAEQGSGGALNIEVGATLTLVKA